MALKSILPACGMYRTTKALPEHESVIGAGVLVYFHNHSDSGLPVVTAPDHNIMNRWHFHGAGIPFRGLSWADTLIKLPPERLFPSRCTEQLRPMRRRWWSKARPQRLQAARLP